MELIVELLELSIEVLELHLEVLKLVAAIVWARPSWLLLESGNDRWLVNSKVLELQILEVLKLGATVV